MSKILQEFKNYKINLHKLTSSRVGDVETLYLVDELDSIIEKSIISDTVYGVLHLNGCSKEYFKVKDYNKSQKILCVERGISSNVDNTISSQELTNKAGRYNSIYISFDSLPPHLDNKSNSTTINSAPNYQATENTKGIVYTQYTPNTVNVNYKAKVITGDNPSYKAVLDLFLKGKQDSSGRMTDESLANLKLAKETFGSIQEINMIIKLFFGDNPKDSSGDLTQVAINKFNALKEKIEKL